MNGNDVRICATSRPIGIGQQFVFVNAIIYWREGSLPAIKRAQLSQAFLVWNSLAHDPAWWMGVSRLYIQVTCRLWSALIPQFCSLTAAYGEHGASTRGRSSPCSSRWPRSPWRINCEPGAGTRGGVGAGPQRESPLKSATRKRHFNLQTPILDARLAHWKSHISQCSHWANHPFPRGAARRPRNSVRAPLKIERKKIHIYKKWAPFIKLKGNHERTTPDHLRPWLPTGLSTLATHCWWVNR